MKLMVLVLVAALAGPFFLKGPDGQPLMRAGDYVPDWDRLAASASYQWGRLTGKAKAAVSGDPNGGKTAIYKTRDADGNWVYSNTPPADGNAEVVYVDPDVNLMPATPAPAPRAPAPVAEQPAPEPSVVPPLLQPERVEQL
ncbi:MAG: hypothetical protein AAGD86_12680, partial [Pseudomonadota bacterium]